MTTEVSQRQTIIRFTILAVVLVEWHILANRQYEEPHLGLYHQSCLQLLAFYVCFSGYFYTLLQHSRKQSFFLLTISRAFLSKWNSFRHVTRILVMWQQVVVYETYVGCGQKLQHLPEWSPIHTPVNWMTIYADKFAPQHKIKSHVWYTWEKAVHTDTHNDNSFHQSFSAASRWHSRQHPAKITTPRWHHYCSPFSRILLLPPPAAIRGQYFILHLNISHAF